MRQRLICGAAALLLLGMAGPAAARQGAPVGPLPTARLTATVQVQYNTTSVDEAAAGSTTPIAPSTFEIRRLRMGVDLRLAEGLSGRVEPELAMGRLGIRSAWAEYALGSGWSVRIGQFKKPFGLIQSASSTVVPTIERGARIRGLQGALAQADAAAEGAVLSRLRGRVLLGEHMDLLDGLGHHGYDIGAQLTGTAGALRLQAGLFNGSGPDQLDETARKSMVGRATYDLPLAVPVRIGVAASYRELAGAQRADGRFESLGGWAEGVELEVGGFRRPGARVMTEAYTGENFAAGGRFRAAQAIASWYVPLAAGGRFEGVEPVARASWGDPRTNTAGDDALLLTVGGNAYLAGRNRLMLNWDVYAPRGDRFARQQAVRAQAQIYY